MNEERWQAARDGCAKLVHDKDLARSERQPYVVRWVREFLLFAQGHGGYTSEQTLDMFLAGVGGRVGVKGASVVICY